LKRNVRLIVEYDGTEFCGWQRQQNGPSIQGHLEAALEELLGPPTPVTGASRTDAGVHALGQVCNFYTEHASIPVDGIRKALNSVLPPAIAVVGAEEVAADFHARFSSAGKHYRYRILSRKSRSPTRRLDHWHLDYPLDVSAMWEGAQPLVGEHDFSAFRAAGCTANTTHRRVTAVEVRTEGTDSIVIDLRGNAFLRNMVRIIAGTLVEIGAGRRAVDDVRELLRHGDRTRAGRTAPAAGLTLMRVYYPPERV